VNDLVKLQIPVGNYSVSALVAELNALIAHASQLRRDRRQAPLPPTHRDEYDEEEEEEQIIDQQPLPSPPAHKSEDEMLPLPPTNAGGYDEEEEDIFETSKKKPVKQLPSEYDAQEKEPIASGGHSVQGDNELVAGFRTIVSDNPPPLTIDDFELPRDEYPSVYDNEAIAVVPKAAKVPNPPETIDQYDEEEEEAQVEIPIIKELSPPPKPPETIDGYDQEEEEEETQVVEIPPISITRKISPPPILPPETREEYTEEQDETMQVTELSPPPTPPLPPPPSPPPTPHPPNHIGDFDSEDEEVEHRRDR
jgi:hypothetical protein